MERRRKHPGHGSSQNACPVASLGIKIFNRQSNLPLKAASVRRLVAFFLQEKKVDCKKVALYFVGQRKIGQLHADFFQDPTTTDCITFPLGDGHLGEIFICPQAAINYNPQRPYEEVSLYILHSLLHLLGYEDIDKKKRAVMRKEEKRLMKLANKNRCLLPA